ncbi:MAG: tRNA pseudouridine(55) synthase TruB [Deltaproteobacteria bacterium]|nr:tRNA pseudouridine(55) synthase TruB [Deltaproteobacteria bacterium]
MDIEKPFADARADKVRSISDASPVIEKPRGPVPAGVLVIDKPQGWTSHDVVAHVKRKLKAKKVGHLGTLDPLATGVLVLVIDGATKCSNLLDTGAKEYVAMLKLGEETDTYDREGKIVASADASAVTDEAVRRGLDNFRGRIKQVPPMYSAIKSGGTPLYKLARKGVTIEREAREVEIYNLDVVRIDLPIVEFRALCSRGTYLRSICHDLGVLLGVGAHLVELRRTASGSFSIDEAAGPGMSGEELSRKIIPLDEALKRASGAAQKAACDEL